MTVAKFLDRLLTIGEIVKQEIGVRLESGKSAFIFN